MMQMKTMTHDDEIEQNTINQLPVRYGKSAVPPFFYCNFSFKL